MSRYYVEIRHKRNETVKSAPISHCRVGHFLAACDKRDWEVLTCTPLKEKGIVEVESVDDALQRLSAGQSIH